MSNPAVPESDNRHRAIDPAASVFLTANAGSGKTTILTRRVIRLMLEGAEPSRILCLTYTKAAAAEMSNRIFGELGAWVRLNDAELSRRVAELTGRRTDDSFLARARALFAHAVETPGGLKIQTIHAFSERLLHLFPFEANVPARFTVMDDLRKAEMLESAKRTIIRQALDAPLSELGQAFFEIADRVGEDDFDELIRAAMPLLRKNHAETFSAEDWRRHLATALSIDLSDTEERIAEAILSDSGFGPDLWQQALDALHGLRANVIKIDDKKLLDGLPGCIAASGNIAMAEALIDLVMTDAGSVRVRLLNGGAKAQIPWLSDALDTLRHRLPPLMDHLKRWRTLQRSTAFMVVADQITGRYRADKRARALIDFDDMIDRALKLVSSSNGASWVLMKLDGGIDHLLIDEAQDTTPEMWQIARMLTSEFFSGQSARDINRTVFAVGDEKQSIYSFQGAQPAAFDESRRYFAKVVKDAKHEFRAFPLQFSFRTVDDILSAVDRVFSKPERYDGLTAVPEHTLHFTARAGQPGFVEIWPLEPPPEKTTSDPWAPVDAPGENTADARLAQRLAQNVVEQIADGRYDNDGKRISAGDIMILVQQRGRLSTALIRALKQRGVPVAGADRLKLNEEIAAMDLIAAARVAMMPEDDLAVAEALKSPLLGLKDDDLITLAPHRAGSLHAALQASADLKHLAAAADIAYWRMLAVRETPYGFFSHILGPMGGRKRLLARLGPDAADGIDIFLASVMERETLGVTSLSHEIAAFQSLSVDIKRDQEHGADAVRVLTVHGSKGLEARIVYLPDCHRAPNFSKDAPLYPADSATATKRALMWARSKDRPDLVEAQVERMRAAKRQEYRRLFYVAMTRARDRLYIAGIGTAKSVLEPDKKTNTSRINWYAMAHEALAADCRIIPRNDGGDVLQWRTTPVAAVGMVAPDSAGDAPVATLPSWALRRAPADFPVLPPLRPSRVLDAADQDVAPERDAARQRGDLVHHLIERIADLPENLRADAGAALLSARAPRLVPQIRRTLLDQALALLNAPQTAGLFGPGSQAEVAICGDVTLPSGRIVPVLGRIDRLRVAPDEIVIADIKTGVHGLKARDLAQLALYRALIGQIFPGKTVRTLAIFTQGARIIDVADADLSSALASL